jgi:hypothetical protein
MLQNSSDKDILFYSQHCPYSQRAVELLRRPTIKICVDRHDCKSMLPPFVDRVPFLLVFTGDSVGPPLAYTDSALFNFLEEGAEAPPRQPQQQQQRQPQQQQPTGDIEGFVPGGLYSESYIFLSPDGQFSDDACTGDAGRPRGFAYLGYEQHIDTPQAEPLPGDNKAASDNRDTKSLNPQAAVSVDALLARRTAELRM